MTRKDTILIAVVINAGLLAILFATAIIYDSDKMLDQSETQTNFASQEELIKPIEETSTIVAIAEQPAAVSEPITISNSFTEESSQSTVNDMTGKETTTVSAESDTKETKKGETVEVTVKKGDVLEKIAKTHGSTVNAIKKANQLKSEKLKIGQVLKVPPKKEKAKTAKKAEGIIATNDSSEVYHTVKSGDSPWKLAKKYGVEYEEILKLNDMSEEKARNLKIGDKIRVK